jgi:demethylmenaquinone methyltransferase / 2-methoxy-6-polyprenyl-1,4-benzoquinol methylase
MDDVASGTRADRDRADLTRADLSKAPGEVAAMFDGVARRYDLTNTVLSLGQDRQWRRLVRAAVEPRPGERILDLAAGTATSSVPLAADGATVVAADFSLGMLQQGARRLARRPQPGLTLAAADGLRLPFRDGVFDAVTMSFGLRNTADPQRCLAELYRVTRPGGRLVICEFSVPTLRPFRALYRDYLMRALPSMARRVSSNPDAYVYLAESIRAWPDQAGLAEVLQRAGWREVAWRNLSGGIVALHRGQRPASAPDRLSAAYTGLRSS